jgi:hypothetical protein
VYGIALALLGALTLFLALAVLGSMRETVILRVEVEALSQLITSPPPPSFIDGPAPGDLRRLLESIEPMWTDPGSSLVAFVTPGCRPCDDVATELSRAAAEGQIREDDLLFVVWASETMKSAALRRVFQAARSSTATATSLVRAKCGQHRRF